ncbi:MAG: glycosyltransferase [Pseudomonadota bacterium]
MAYFGHDRTDSKVISRIEHLRRLGYKVLGLTYHRIKFNLEHKPDWENIDLGVTEDYAYLQRLKSLMSGVRRVFRERRRLADVDLIFARNIDMALLALAMRLITGNRAPIAYEVLDVHRFFLGDRGHHRFFRALERFVLHRCDALVVSSSGYVRHYFEPIQNYKGRWFLLENKVPIGSVREVENEPEHRPSELGKPWVIGWCGTMRCVESLRMLTEIARRNRDTVRIYMRGFPTETGLEAFKAQIADEPNMIYAGGYKGPEDLAEVYAEVDINWTIELWDHSYDSQNSHWLLPNRLYEGGCFQIPMIALADTETAQRVEELDAGWVFDQPLVDSVSRLLETLTPEAYRNKREKLKALPTSTFWEIDDLEQICDHLVTLQKPDQSVMVSV